MPAPRRLLVPLLLLFCAAVAAADAGTAPDVRRPFRMGFSPWPWDATPAAVEWTYETIQRHGDIVSFHVEEGVPWNEALSGAAFPAAMQKDIEARLAHVRQDMPRILQVSALDVARSGLAGRRGSGINEPLSAPWSTYGMDHPDVKAAYANYVERMIRTFRPTYVVFGVEANLLKRNRKQQWSAYVELTCATYRTLKGRGVGPPLLVSIDVNPFFPEWSTPDPAGDQPRILRELDACVDGFAISSHPFMSALLADTLPPDYFARVFALSRRWVGISETSYPAQVFSSGSLTWNGSEARQSAFVDALLSASARHGLRFVVWFAVRDFDPLWSGLLRRDPVSLMWRDTGLYDETGRARAALRRWSVELERPLR